MSYPSYPQGYMYPNEHAMGLIWLPIIVTYTVLISISSGSSFLLSLGYLAGVRSLIQISPLLLSLAFSTGVVFLLGPLADLRRPDRAIYIMIYPHIAPSDMYPGVSFIALMASIMWPLLILVLALMGYLVIFRGLRSGIAIKALSALLLVISITWSTYYAGLLFSTMYSLSIYNLVPMLPVEFFLESLAISCAASLTILSITARRSARDEAYRALAMGTVAGLTGYLIFRSMEIFMLFTIKTGSPEIQVFNSVFINLNITALALALASILVSIMVLKTRSTLYPFILFILSILWISIDRWIFTVDIQSISKTILSVVPYTIDYTWVIESIGMVLIAMSIYYALNTFIIRSPFVDISEPREGGEAVGKK